MIIEQVICPLCYRSLIRGEVLLPVVTDTSSSGMKLAYAHIACVELAEQRAQGDYSQATATPRTITI